ncbi:MAG TPA: YbaK/EbsC family protein [Alphaproteobacteria bacterium]|nr:YbaK/EbsC family protein [Alphaproteobacteria bacterium]
MSETMLSPSARKVELALRARGFTNEIVEHAQPTRSSAEAAAAVGCTVNQIAKSIVFRARGSGRPVLVVASGPNRVNEAAVEAALGEKLGKADASFVRERTGFVIGGVPPLGHAQPLTTFIDADLMELGEIWAAAGTPNAVFKLTPEELVRMTGGQVISIK